MTGPAGAADARDRLFELLPLAARTFDEAAGHPLRDLLRVIAEQAQVVQEDIARTYDNWFVETAEDWAVACLAELIGWSPPPPGPGPGPAPGGTAGRDLAVRALRPPRQDVAATLGHRRRKGTRSLLEDLAPDVAGLPGRAVEFAHLLARSQHVNHLRPDRGRTADVRGGDPQALPGGLPGSPPHTVDVRRPTSHRTAGRYGIASVGLFVPGTRAYSVTATEACRVERVGRWAFTFDATGFDVQLYGPGADGGAGLPGGLPGAITRRGLGGPGGRTASPLHYGEGRSLVIRAPGWPAPGQGDPVLSEQVVPADLGDWQAWSPRPGTVAVDPVLGRMLFPRTAPPQQVRVSYHYGFGADLGGGEYRRPLPELLRAGPPSPAAGRRTAAPRPSPAGPARWYRSATGADELRAALAALEQERPPYAVVEITAGTVVELTAGISLRPDQHLLLRAAERVRPVLCPAGPQAPLSVTLAPGSWLTLDGLLVAGPVHLAGDGGAGGDGRRAARVVVRHCTLVPGRTPRSGGAPGQPAPPALELAALPGADVGISHCIVGPVQVTGPPGGEPLRLTVADSVLDATAPAREAVGAGGQGPAPAVLDIARTTVLGTVRVHAVDHGENTVFTGPVTAARVSRGSLRHCWVPAGSRTPRRLHCGPGTEQAPSGPGAWTAPAARLVSVRYPDPGYARLAPDCPEEIRAGADDGAELGAFHDLYLTRRLDALRARMSEYVPAGVDAALFQVD
ncbi:hypothetical protein OH738_36385 [Streptomyces hirsutus]|uniref:hypothetical protein n=1 Tax=Streptomyces hirsutus TaxID=35620 RepID=UPI003870B28B|nr:hypothetical protein OH738_36385 [Streptomyces hirsutus]